MMIPHHSVWQCTAKDLQMIYFTGDESKSTISVNSLWLQTPKLIPIMRIRRFTSAEQLIKNFTQKKILCHNRMRIKISVGVPSNIFGDFGVLSPILRHFERFGSVLPSGMVTVKSLGCRIVLIPFSPAIAYARWYFKIPLGTFLV